MIILRQLRLATAIGLCFAGTLPAAADGLAGAYLAGRQASFASDFQNAAAYFTQALVRDPSNLMLMENAVLSNVGLGAVDKAIPIARRMQQAGAESQFASLVLLVDQLQRQAYAEAATDTAAGRKIVPLVDGLVAAWSELGQGRMSEALAGFDATAKGPGLKAFALYHKALALASVGDFEGADELLSGRGEGPLQMSRRGVIAHIEVLSQLERNADAIELIDATFDAELDTGMKTLRARLVAGEVLPFDVVRDPTEGLAEVFLTLATALDGDADDGYTLIYTRMSEYLRPGNADALLLCADLLAAQEQFDLAGETFNRVARDDPAFIPAEIGRADALYQGGKTDAALEVIEALAKGEADEPVVLVTLGDMLRREERYDDASTAYDQALAQLPVTKPGHWVIYFSRGIAHERLGRIDKAETDMRLALDLNPDQPQVLNYLGYAFVDANRNLDEALSMIERAVAARPDDGYIVDSLGWALYRLGRYDEALGMMERAAEIEAVDPIINDHLGDVYWAVGRKIEAEFQWHRALSFDPEDKDEARIKRKLEVGLDAVLAAEGAEPLATQTADGN